MASLTLAGGGLVTLAVGVLAAPAADASQGHDPGPMRPNASTEISPNERNRVIACLPNISAPPSRAGPLQYPLDEPGLPSMESESRSTISATIPHYRSPLRSMRNPASSTTLLQRHCVLEHASDP